jgi:hypothetical protein
VKKLQYFKSFLVCQRITRTGHTNDEVSHVFIANNRPNQFRCLHRRKNLTCPSGVLYGIIRAQVTLAVIALNIALWSNRQMNAAHPVMGIPVKAGMLTHNICYHKGTS